MKPDVPLTPDLGWIYDVNAYSVPARPYQLGEVKIQYTPLQLQGGDYNVYKDMLGIDDRQIQTQKENGTYDQTAFAYMAGSLAYNGWNFFTVGFLDRQAERYNQLDTSSASYWTASAVDGVYSVASIALGARVYNGAVSRLGEGLWGQVVGGAAAGYTGVLAQKYGEALSYQSSDPTKLNQQFYNDTYTQLTLGTALGAGLPLVGPLMSGAARGMNKVLWNSPNMLNPLKWKIVQPTVSSGSRELLGSVADTTGSSILNYAGGQIQAAGGRVISLPGTSTYTTQAAIDWLQALPELSTMVNANAQPWEQAVQAVNLKNYFMTISRNAMDDANAAAQLGMTTPTRTFQELELDAFSKGYYGNAAYRHIIAEADKEMRFKLDTSSYSTREGWCFAAGTLVHTKEGLKPIEQIKVGDWVLSQPEEGGEKAYKRVAKTFCFDNEPVLSIEYIEKDVRDRIVAEGRTYGSEIKSRLIVTPNHPFWVKDKGWILAKDLNIWDLFELENKCFALVDYVAPLYKYSSEGMAWRPNQVPGRDPLGKLIDFNEGKSGEFDFQRKNWDWEHLDEDLNDPAFYYRTTVYNFEVEDFHTYYVGAKGVWVHNTCYADNVGSLQPYIDNGIIPSNSLSIYFRESEARQLGGINRGVILVQEPIKIGFNYVPSRFQLNEEGAQIIYRNGEPTEWAIFSYRYDNPEGRNFVRAGDGRAKMPDGKWSMTTIDSKYWSQRLDEKLYYQKLQNDTDLQDDLFDNLLRVSKAINQNNEFLGLTKGYSHVVNFNSS